MGNKWCKLMEYLYGTASSISRDLVCGTINEIRYLCCFNNLVKELEKEEGNLIATRDSVRDRVEQAHKQTKKTAQVVHKWLKEANADIDNVDELLKKARTKKSYCFGHCPNWIWRYCLGKKLAKKKKDLKTYIEEGRQYIQLESPASLAGYFSSEKCWEFESRKSAYEELMNALEDDEVSMIGLYGMGGCGKTMLAMEVMKRANLLFDKVLFVPVSNTVQVQKIQDKIAGSLEFEFQEKDEMDRSQRLCMRVIQEDKILVILDDVWQMLDFDAIGIPSIEHHKCCKVLITTRSEAVCTLMDCQKMIHLSILTNNEAWVLFQKQALLSEETSISVKHLAREISDECKGLPVAIVAVASSLKGKAEVEWKVALDRLRNSKLINIEKGLPNPYECLLLSYDNLDFEEAKSLFLLCSVFPEDCEILVEFLTRSAIGLGIFGEIHSYEGARNEVTAAKNKLVSSCLLLDANGGKIVKMHDVVRDIAYWIAENENKIIKCALEKDVTLEHNSVRYLWCEKFPNDLDCSNLEFVCIHTYLEVSDETFNEMKMLRVLFLSNKARYRRPLLAMSLKSLKNLRCMLLSKWELGDISFVDDMKKLESLTLRDCSFFELTNVVVTQLTNLRLLDLSECDMKISPFEVIGRHPRLEELYFTDHRSKWDFYNEHAAEFFQEFRVPQVLQRYHIQLGIMFAGFQEELPNCHRNLLLSYLDTSNGAVRDLAKTAEVLCLANIEGGAKNIIPDIFQIQGGTDHLIKLFIRDSEEIECLVDTSHPLSEVGALFSKLHWLRIEHMKHLRALYHGSLPPGVNFEKLEELYLSHCPKLTCLFTLEVAQNLVHMKKLEMISCPGLKHILTDDDREEITSDDKKMLFPKLKQLHVKTCDALEYLIPITFAGGLVQLECLEIVCNSELKYVFGQCTNGAHLVGQNQNELKIDLTSLEELTLNALPDIISICPEVCCVTWPSLRQFSVQNCPGFSIVSINTCLALHNNQIINEASHLTVQHIKEVRVNNCELEGVIQLAELSVDGKQDSLTSCLEMLYLENLPQLRYICKGDIQFINLLQNLQQMEVSGCRKLKSVFSAYISGGLPQLKALKIENCNQLEQIIEDKKRIMLLLFNYFPGSFNMPNLTRLMVKSCPLLGPLFTTSTAKTLTSLEELIIQDCHRVEHILVQYDHDFQSYMTVFPSLKKLNVMRCHLLQYIFPVSFAKGLEQLETIEIRETPKLIYLFGPNIHSSHQYLNKIQIEFPVLKKITLHSIPNMINICPENYYATCPSLQLLVMNDVGLPTLFINNLMDDSVATQSNHSSIMVRDSGTTTVTIKQKLVTVTIENSSKLKDVFHLEEFPINGKQVTLCLEVLKLFDLPELRYIWTTTKQFVSLQVHLHKLHICNCPKLKAIFSTSVLRMLPLLKILVVEHCEELEQIIEDDKENENVSNPQSPKVCFSQLKFLLVTHCNNLKNLFFISISHEFPELEYLILNHDSHLMQVFEGEAGVREGRVEVLLPKLKHVVLIQLPNLINICQGIEFQTMINLLVHNCPKFSLTSTTIAEDMLQTSNSDKEIDFYLRPHLLNISGIITKGHEVLTSKKDDKGIQDLQSWEQKLPLIPLPNLTENFEEAKTTIIGDVPASVIPTSASILSREALTSSSTCLYNIPLNSIVRVAEDGTVSNNANMVTSSLHSDFASSQLGQLVTSQSKSYLHSEIGLGHTEKYSAKESESHPINILDLEANDLIRVVQPAEEDGEAQITTSSIYVVAGTAKHRCTDIVVKALVELEECLKMPLKDIASFEANSLRLLTALNFLSHLPLQDVTLSDELKAIIDSINKEFPSILCSFKQAFAITNKLGALEAHWNELAVTLVSKISEAKNFMDEAQQKETVLKERIVRLEKELKDCQANLSSLQEKKKKCIAETIEYKEKIENMRQDKSQMMEDQRKVREELFEVGYRWSTLCSQFEHHRIVARVPS
ncbi:uncharacterized protein LOC113855315 [Abrus precatorius]|uniref:Uncharacterized protein LOC113855315 n=1 Tax=Abrus precatorius TaxID=3816 RepID=A0A8B8KHJ4_ABRPR|nr:uncharacterized protein LOC113855315 [Abrus precatorius]